MSLAAGYFPDPVCHAQKKTCQRLNAALHILFSGIPVTGREWGVDAPSCKQAFMSGIS